MPDNRRKYMRIPVSGDVAEATIHGSQQKVSVINQSIGGIRIGNIALDRLNRGDRIEIDFAGEVIEGVAQSLTRIDERTYEMGIRRADVDEDDGDRSALLVSYIHLQNRWICCRIVEDLDAQSVRIALLDGKTFKVERSVLFQLTCDERLQMLREGKHYQQAVEFYQIIIPQTKITSLADVLNLEFGKEASVPV